MSDSSFSQYSEEEKPYKRKTNKSSVNNHRHQLRKRAEMKQVNSFRYAESSSNEQSNQSSSVEEEKEKEKQREESLFKTQIEVIVNEKVTEDEKLYLCKLKNVSYLHLKWLTEEEINNMLYGKMKITRYKKEQSKKVRYEEYQSDEENNLQKTNSFDPIFLEVDRIIQTPEIFLVVHPRQGQFIQGKWQEKCAMLISKLMNFYKNYIAYAQPFLEPVDPLLDGVPDYLKIIKNPMDFVQMHNRLHNGFYKHVQSF